MTKPKIVDQRAEHYGDAYDNHSRISTLWSAYLGHPVSAEQVAMCMILVKISRSVVAYHPDNFEDIVGYAAIAREIAQRDA